MVRESQPTTKISAALLQFARPALELLPPEPAPADVERMCQTPWHDAADSQILETRRTSGVCFQLVGARYSAVSQAPFFRAFTTRDNEAIRADNHPLQLLLLTVCGWVSRHQ